VSSSSFLTEDLNKRWIFLLNRKMTSNGLQNYRARLVIILLFLLLVIPETRLRKVEDIAVVCRVQKDVIVDVDPGKHRYYPYMVKLPRCAGSVHLSQPNIKKCVATASNTMSYKVHQVPNFNPVTVNLAYHTSCKGECVKSSSSCNKFQTWNGNDCYCNCKYKTAPSPTPCRFPLIWRQSKCNCVCPSQTKTCPDEKEWNAETCMCSCKKRYLNRCERKRKFLNQENCKCINMPLVNATAAARGSEMKCDGIKSKYVVAICISEFLLLMVVFVFIYCHCLRDPEPRSTPYTQSSNDETCKFQLNQKSTCLQPCFPANGLGATENSADNSKIENEEVFDETSTGSINKCDELSSVHYDAQSSRHGSSTTYNSLVTPV